MDFSFSLNQDHQLTPIKTQRVEQLFSPNINNILTPSRIRKSDITYQVPLAPLAQATFTGQGDNSFELPEISNNFPRQSTCLKPNVRPTSLEPSGDEKPLVSLESGATSINLTYEQSLLGGENNANIYYQYQPLYQMEDSLPFRGTCFHPTGDVFVVGSNSKTLSICLYPTDEELEQFNNSKPPSQPRIAFKFQKVHLGSIYCCNFNSSGNLLATGSNDRSIHIIRYSTEKRLPIGDEYSLPIHSGTIRDLCFLHNEGSESSVLISGGTGDNEIHITDCGVMKQKQVLFEHQASVMSLHCWGDSNLFASGSLDGTIKFWDARSKLCSKKVDTQHLYGKSAPVCSIRIDETGKLLIAGHQDGKCMLYDIRGGRLIQSFQAHDKEIRTLNISPKSYYLLTGSYDHKIKMMDLQGDLTKKLPIVEVADLGDKVVQTAWHPHDYNFVSTSANGVAALWSLPEMGKLVQN